MADSDEESFMTENVFFYEVSGVILLTILFIMLLSIIYMEANLWS